MVTEDKEIDFFVGTKIGSFKHIKYFTDPSKNSKKCIENLVDIKTLQKDEGITCMVWGNTEQTEILLGKQNQQIQVYDTQQGFTKSYTADFGTGHVVGLGRYKRKLVAAVSGGVVKVWSKKSEQIYQTGKLDRMRMCPDDASLFATGGEENDLKVWRIGSPEPTFSAKNLAHDWLQLRRPVWVSDLTFLPGEGGQLLAVCSRHGYVRSALTMIQDLASLVITVKGLPSDLCSPEANQKDWILVTHSDLTEPKLYDTRAQRRPVCNVEFPMAATCIAPSFDERQVLVGFARGQLHQVDLRTGKPGKGYKGSAGCVTAAVGVGVGVGARLVGSAGLDRTLRVHDYSTKELLYKQYLTSKLSCFLAQTETHTPLKLTAEVKEEEEAQELEEQGVVEVPDDMDELFDNMETVGEKPKKKLPEEPPSKKQKVQVEDEDAIINLLRSTEKQKKKRDKKKKEKKAKSVFHNA